MAKLSDRVVEYLSVSSRVPAPWMLGFVASDGRPLVTPVWFVVEKDGDDGQLAFTTERHTPKGLALQRDPRVASCVDDPHPPYSFVQVQGVATVSDDPGDVLDPSICKRPEPVRATWAPIAPTSSAAATRFPANWRCRVGPTSRQQGSSPDSISATKRNTR